MTRGSGGSLLAQCVASAAIVVTIAGCGHATSAQSQSDTTPATAVSTVTAPPHVGACDFGTQIAATSFFTPYIVPGTARLDPNASDQTYLQGTSECSWEWTSASGMNSPDELRIRMTCYGGYGVLDKDAATALAFWKGETERDEQSSKTSPFNPITDTRIGAGAVIGDEEFFVMGTHGFYYRVDVSGWTPTSEVVPMFTAMAKAIAAADS
ncbi:hypothetical protein [Mycolicibacterium sp. CBMA 226]|uniref:hypothetical protein n=1 Tax=Mycolicibacterium sp. CBMA 226 TaxID=2606611 RepID=UPI0012DE05E6|nr:hypothetical protein [Mycolicibacterium sp. CBMA 226]